jgi:hypothetical protein
VTASSTGRVAPSPFAFEVGVPMSVTFAAALPPSGSSTAAAAPGRIRSA